MACPYCQGDATQELERTTALRYCLFRCRPCRRTVNERTGTPFNHLQVPTDIALLVVLWRLRYKLSLRDRKRQDSEHNRADEGRGTPWCLLDLAYAACSTAHTSPHRSWNRRRYSAKDTVSVMCWR